MTIKDQIEQLPLNELAELSHWLGEVLLPAKKKAYEQEGVIAMSIEYMRDQGTTTYTYAEPWVAPDPNNHFTCYIGGDVVTHNGEMYRVVVPMCYGEPGVSSAWELVEEEDPLSAD